MKCSQRVFRCTVVTFDCSINNESNATLAVTHMVCMKEDMTWFNIQATTLITILITAHSGES